MAQIDDAARALWTERRRRIFYPKTDLHLDPRALQQRKLALGSVAPAFLPSILEEIRSIEFLPTAGTLHAVFRIETSTRNSYLKLPLEDPDFAVDIEACAYERIIPCGLPNLVSPMDRRLLAEAPGRPLTSFENPETQAIPEPVLFEFGRTLARIHQLECSGAGLLDPAAPTVGLHSRWSDYILLRLDDHLDICARIGAISEIEGASIRFRFLESTSLINSAPSRLLHGDPGHHNVFSDGSRITAIIDWEDALAGDPVFDVAFWGTFVRDEMRARFLDGYGTIQSLPDDFELRYWLYYLRIALSKTAHRHLFGAKDRPGRTPASRRIQKALSKLAEI